MNFLVEESVCISFEEAASTAGDKFNVDEARWRSLLDAEKHGVRAIVARALQGI